MNDWTGELFHRFNLGDGHHLLAVLFGELSSRRHFFVFRLADVVMERLADVILRQIIIDGLAVLLDLEDILAFLGFVQHAFGTDHHAGEGDFLA